MTTKTKTPAARRKEAEHRLAEIHANVEARAMEKTLSMLESPEPVRVPWQEYPGFDDFNRWPSGGGSAYYWSDMDDRTEGRYRPIYENSQDLSRMRAEARRMKAFFPIAAGAESSLTNYVVGSGMEYTVQAKEGLAIDPVFIALVQSLVDEFVDQNNFVGDLDREAHANSREDGEVFLTLYADGPRVRCDLTPPEFILQPMKGDELAKRLGLGHKLNYWWHGVHTLFNPVMRRDDVTRPMGYHAVFDRIGDQWDYIPACRVEHIKRNVGRNGRRGVSDYALIMEDLTNEAKIRRNTAIGAYILAAIVLIRQHAEGTSKSSVEAMLTSNATSSYRKPVEGGSRTTSEEHVRPGTVKDTPAGLTTMLGPLGTLRSPVYLEVAQYLQRVIGIRWCMPEYMISGDASNANFASTQQAGTPFVKAREVDQEFYASRFKNLIWKAIRMYYEAGRIGRANWQQVRQLLDIKVDYTSTENRDPEERARTNSILVDKKVMSKRTMASDHGLDYDEEQKSIAEEPKEEAPMMGGFGQQGGFGGGFNPRAFEARTESLAIRAIDILTERSRGNA